MHLTIFIVAVATSTCIYAEGHLKNGRRCYSRFEYEYQVVGKLFESEDALKKQHEINTELRAALEDLKSSSDYLTREVDILKGSSLRGNIVLSFGFFNVGIKIELDKCSMTGYKSKKEGKDQKSIQSSTKGHHMGI